MRSESEIQQLIQIEAAKRDVYLMRNNSGALLDKDGRLVRYGLGNISKKVNESMKSSDLIGIRPVFVTPDMVGKIIGVFTSVECKAEGWNRNKKKDKRETAQDNFIRWVLARGGDAGFASRPEDLDHIIK